MSPYHLSPHPDSPRSGARRGFTVVELLIVIVIIAILAALLLPAIGAVRTRAAMAQISVDIKALETGIATFNTNFGSQPPSRITLYENPLGWTTDTASRSAIRRIWPQFDFTLYRDINGDGDMLDGSGMHDPTSTAPNDQIDLNGAECLVFFLGGVAATNMVDGVGNAPPGADPPNSALTPTAWAPLGFSKNPKNPFERGGGTRIGPFGEMDSSRFVNVFNTGTNQGIPEYIDTLPSQSNPYLYASSYDGKGYKNADLAPAMNQPYRQKTGSTAAGHVMWNQNGFQIISPGLDGLYGTGGEFLTEEGYTLPPGRSDERDNVTNFSGGPLND